MWPISPIREFFPLRMRPPSIRQLDSPQQEKITSTRFPESSGSKRKGLAVIFPAFSKKIRVSDPNQGFRYSFSGTFVPHWGDWELYFRQPV